MMQWGWIDLNFPWIGLAGAVAVVVLLFSTSWLQSDLRRSRWRDSTWLSWLAAAIYLVHNVEEYGVDLLGQSHAFPASMCTTLGQPPYPMCLIPPAFFLAVNLPLFWVGAPIAALISRRHPIVGLSCYGIIFVNGLSHTAASARVGYNPGALTALILFLPICVWITRACFGKYGLPFKALVFIGADGVILHVILIGSTILFLRGIIGSSALIAIQILNAATFFVLAWLCERWLNDTFVRSEGVITHAS